MTFVLMTTLVCCQAIVDDAAQPNWVDQASMELIKSSPSPHHTDPGNQIRAVNALHSLGFEEAREVLAAYWSRYGLIDPTDPSATLARGPWSPGDQREELICFVLFTVDSESKWHERWAVCDHPSCAGLSRTFQVVVHDDIPFQLMRRPYGGMRTTMGIPGGDGDVRCRMRDDPLQPSSNPFQSAEEVIRQFTSDEYLTHAYDSRVSMAADDRAALVESIRHHIRAQSIQLVFGEYRQPSEAEWRALQQWAAEDNLTWDGERNVYDLRTPFQFAPRR